MQHFDSEGKGEGREAEGDGDWEEKRRKGIQQFDKGGNEREGSRRGKW